MGRVAEWVRERLPVDRAQLREVTNELVPHHLMSSRDGSASGGRRPTSSS